MKQKFNVGDKVKFKGETHTVKSYVPAHSESNYSSKGLYEIMNHYGDWLWVRSNQIIKYEPKHVSEQTGVPFVNKFTKGDNVLYQGKKYIVYNYLKSNEKDQIITSTQIYNFHNNTSHGKYIIKDLLTQSYIMVRPEKLNLYQKQLTLEDYGFKKGDLVEVINYDEGFQSNMEWNGTRGCVEKINENIKNWVIIKTDNPEHAFTFPVDHLKKIETPKTKTKKINVSLSDAINWYASDDESLQKLALQFYTKEELVNEFNKVNTVEPCSDWDLLNILIKII